MARASVTTPSGARAILGQGGWRVFPGSDDDATAALWAAIDAQPGYLPLGACVLQIAESTGGTVLLMPEPELIPESEGPPRVY